jgi:hypothetical protein
MSILASSSQYPTRTVRAHVTEPTMHDGVWTLAKFFYDARVTVSRSYVEDLAMGLTQFGVVTTNDERVYFDDWLEGMPRIYMYEQAFTPSFEQDIAHETYRFRFWTKGVFDLGNEAQMEKLLSRVSDTPLTNVRDVVMAAAHVFTPSTRQLPIERPMLRPGTANNDLQHVVPTAYVEQFCTPQGEIRHRVVRPEDMERRRVVARGERVDWVNRAGSFIDWDTAYRRAPGGASRSPGERAAMEAARRLASRALGEEREERAAQMMEDDRVEREQPVLMAGRTLPDGTSEAVPAHHVEGYAITTDERGELRLDEVPRVYDSQSYVEESINGDGEEQSLDDLFFEAMERPEGE